MKASFFFIAGEASADALGAGLIRALRARDQHLVIEGIGGDLMKKEGLESLLPMENLVAIGLWEVLWHIKRLKNILDAMVEEIEIRQPSVVVTIDLPDFNFRLAKQLKARGKFKGKIVHYVAPTVWAWRPGRAKKIAQYLDGLVCLFPFEPAYFTKHGLHAIYCGHPLSELQVDQIDKDWFDKRFEVSEGHKKIGLFLGSRESELKTIAPVIVEAVNGLYEHYQDFSVIIPTLPRLELDITNIASSLPCEAFVLCDDQHKWESFMACDMAVAVSGTVALELAYLGVPHFVAYKVHPITWILLKILVKTQYAHIANIVADKEVIPELLQWKCSALEIAKMLMSFIKTPEILEKQKRDMAYLRTELCSPTDKKPSENIADYLLSVLR